MELRNIILGVAAILSPLAAIMAFLITYEEYKHHYPEKRKVWKKALETAVFAFVFFLALGLFLGFILPLVFK